jgi:D-sedoheptulose 7-phosphate isomerase
MTSHSAGPAKAHFQDYSARLAATLSTFDWTPVEKLADELLDCCKSRRQVFLCGNGGSAGNANHLANDMIYAMSKQLGAGLRVQALSANPSVLTCLANDEGYENVFSHQLAVLANKGDVVIAFSGSGNSPNILRVLETAKKYGVHSYALADVPIHFPVDDMQIAEDTQTIIGHMIVQWLYARRTSIFAGKIPEAR